MPFDRLDGIYSSDLDTGQAHALDIGQILSTLQCMAIPMAQGEVKGGG